MNEPQVMVVAVVDGETDIGKLVTKVVQLREFLSKPSDTKPDPDYKRAIVKGTIKDTLTECETNTENRHGSSIPG